MSALYTKIQYLKNSNGSYSESFSGDVKTNWKEWEETELTADKGKMWIHNFEVPLNEFKDDEEMVECFEEQLLKSGFSIFGKLEKKFEPAGITVLWGLCESHLAVHTFPETGLASFQLASCNYEKYRNFLDYNSKEYGC